jgi:hypothetical protein
LVEQCLEAAQATALLQRLRFPSAIIPRSRLALTVPFDVGITMVGYWTTATSMAFVGLLLLASEAASQPPTVPEAPLVIEGRVLWVDFGSQAMALAPANNTPTVTIDLHRLRQSDYQGFRGNEYVRIVGYVLRPSRRIQAFQIYLVTPWFPTEPP